MIKIIASFIIGLLWLPGFSQNIFTKFIENKSVQWAAGINDTFHFANPNLSLILRKKFNEGTIKVSSIENDKNISKIIYATKEAVINRIAPNRERKTEDEDGNITRTIIASENPLLSSYYFDAQTNNLVEIQQVLYIQSGRLKSYIPWVSPKYAVYTSWGQKLGVANVFNTAFNKQRKTFSSSLKKNAQLLGSTKTMMRIDSSQSMLKQLYAQNLLQALWPHLHKKQYQIYRADSAIKIPFEKINKTLVDTQQISIPVYDVEGNITAYKILSQQDKPLELSSITAVEIIQHWFYNAKKNIVFNTIEQLVLYAHKWNNGQQDVQASHILKIMLQ